MDFVCLCMFVYIGTCGGLHVCVCACTFRGQRSASDVIPQMTGSTHFSFLYFLKMSLSLSWSSHVNQSVNRDFSPASQVPNKHSEYYINQKSLPSGSDLLLTVTFKLTYFYLSMYCHVICGFHRTAGMLFLGQLNDVSQSLSFFSCISTRISCLVLSCLAISQSRLTYQPVRATHVFTAYRKTSHSTSLSVCPGGPTCLLVLSPQHQDVSYVSPSAPF